MKPRTVGILAAVVLLLGAFIWWVERDLPGSDERSEQARKILGGLDRDVVEAVTLSLGERRVHLERSDEPGESWRLAAPKDARADEQAVDQLVLVLTRLEKQAPVEEPDRAELGLEPPEAVVTVRADGRERVLRVGVDVPVTGGRVVSLEGTDEVWVTEGELWDEIVREPEAWRSKRAVPWSAAEIVRIRVTGEGREEPLEIVREATESSSAERFRLVAPFEDTADRQTVQSLTSRLATLRIADFLDGPEEIPADVDVDTPRFSLSLQIDRSDDGESHRIDLVDPVDTTGARWLARVEGALVEMEAGELAELLDRPEFAWRSHALTDLQIFELDELRIRSADDGEMVLARTEDEWTRDGGAVPYGPVRELILQLTGARAVDVDAGGDEPAGSPRLVFTLVPEGESPAPETLSVYDDAGTGVPVRVEPRGLVLRFDPDVVGEIEAAVDEVREAEPEAPEAP